MASVLIIDDDLGIRRSVADACEDSGYAVATADSGRMGIRLLEDIRPDVTLVDMVLPDLSGLDVLKHIALAGIDTRPVVITGTPSTRCAVESMRLGALEYLEKPFAIKDLLAILEDLVPSGRRPRAPRLTAHAALRVAGIVAKAIESRHDLKTIEAWARFVGSSPGAIRSWCRAAKVSSKDSLDLARLLRAVVWGRHTGSPPEQLLDVVDPRTLQKLLRLGDHLSTRQQLPATVEDLIGVQRWIDSPELIEAIRRAVEVRFPRPGRE